MMSVAASSTLALSVAVACGGAQEATQVQLPVVADASELVPVKTNLGYHVELTSAKMVIEDLTFAVAGELLTDNFFRNTRDRAYDWVVPNAMAHAGHYSDGDITGELRGHFLVDWLPEGLDHGSKNTDHQLGIATLLEGSYKSANLGYAAAEAENKKATIDPMLGYTALLSGTATRDQVKTQFTALIDLAGADPLVGVPSEFEVREGSTEVLSFQLKTYDEVEGDTLFDDVDFEALKHTSDTEVRILPGPGSKIDIDAHLALSRALQTHDNFRIVAR